MKLNVQFLRALVIKKEIQQVGALRLVSNRCVTCLWRTNWILLFLYLQGVFYSLFLLCHQLQGGLNCTFFFFFDNVFSWSNLRFGLNEGRNLSEALWSNWKCLFEPAGFFCVCVSMLVFVLLFVIFPPILFCDFIAPRMHSEVFWCILCHVIFMLSWCGSSPSKAAQDEWLLCGMLFLDTCRRLLRDHCLLYLLESGRSRF